MADPTSRTPQFTGLASEVRLTIYKHFFSGQPRMITYPGIRPFELIESRHWNLLLASKAIYHEALPEYYRNCIFGLYGLNANQLQKLLNDMNTSYFTQYTANLLVWKSPEPRIFETLNHVRWVKVLGITCGVEPDRSNGQIFTYDSLMTALQKARVPGFSWQLCQELFKKYENIDFTVDFRCDYPEVKFNLEGQPSRRWIKTSFTYDFKADVFVAETKGSNSQDGLVLRPQIVTLGGHILNSAEAIDPSHAETHTLLVLLTGCSSTRLRQKTVVLARMVYNICGIIINFIMPVLLSTDGLNMGARTGLIWAGISVFCIIWCWFRLPETAGRTYGELTILFENKVSARKFKSTKVDSFRSMSISVQQKLAEEERFAGKGGVH